MGSCRVLLQQLYPSCPGGGLHVRTVTQNNGSLGFSNCNSQWSGTEPQGHQTLRELEESVELENRAEPQGEVPKLCPINSLFSYSCFPRDLALKLRASGHICPNNQKTPVAQVRFPCALFFAGHWHWGFYCQRSRGSKRGPTSSPLSKLRGVSYDLLSFFLIGGQ